MLLLLLLPLVMLIITVMMQQDVPCCRRCRCIAFIQYLVAAQQVVLSVRHCCAATLTCRLRCDRGYFCCRYCPDVQLTLLFSIERLSLDPPCLRHGATFARRFGSTKRRPWAQSMNIAVAMEKDDSNRTPKQWNYTADGAPEIDNEDRLPNEMST